MRRPFALVICLLLCAAFCGCPGEPKAKSPSDVEPTPGLMISGRVVDPEGKPIPGATVVVAQSSHNPQFRSVMKPDGRRLNEVKTVPPGQGNSLKTDARGVYEVKTAPAAEGFRVFVWADGYGMGGTRRPVGTDAGEQVTVDDIVLPVANLSVSGVVVDKDDKPVAGAVVWVFGTGHGSPAKTDAEGRFVATGVRSGEVRIEARSFRAPNLYGNATARAGDKDVKVVAQNARPLGAAARPVDPPSLVGKPLPKLDALDDLNGRMRGMRVLVCFWDRNQRPSRHGYQALAARIKELADKEVVFFPVSLGLVAGDDEKTRFDWSVRGLPWLVLADREHVVRAEGFAVEDLDERLKELATDKP